MAGKIPLISFTFEVYPRSIFSGEWEIIPIRQLRPSGWNCSCLLSGAVSRRSTCMLLAVLTADELWSRNHTRTSPIPLCWFFSLNFPGSDRFSACCFPGWKPLYLEWLLTLGKGLRYVDLSCKVLQSPLTPSGSCALPICWIYFLGFHILAFLWTTFDFQRCFLSFQNSALNSWWKILHLLN